MPIPSYVVSTSLLVCERVLLETDGVASAIRMVDLFYIGEVPGQPDGTFPVVQAYVLGAVRADPGHTNEHVFRIRLRNTVGESSIIAEHKGLFESKVGLETAGSTAPRSMNLIVQLNLKVMRYGTCFVYLDIDGEEAARAPITLLQMPSKLKVS